MVRSLAAALFVLLLHPHALQAQEEEGEVEVPIEEIESGVTDVESWPSDTSIFNPKDPNSINQIEQRKVSDYRVDELKNDEAFWYANAERKKKEPEKKSQGSGWGAILDAGWFKAIVWILIIGAFLAVIITFLASSNVRLFRKNPKELSDEETETEGPEDIFSIDYDKAIEEAVSKQQYRRAVRYQYLRTIRDLANKELIRYRPDRTDSDYVFQLAGTPYYQDFFRLTRHFEYTWYGKFRVEPDVYQKLQQDFANFKSRFTA